MIALARVTSYGAWRRKPLGDTPAFADVDTEAARAIVATAMQQGRGWLTPDESPRLLAALAIATPPWRLTETPDEAATAAASIGFPVVVKDRVMADHVRGPTRRDREG